MFRVLLLLFSFFMIGCTSPKNDTDKEEWIPLFDGSSMEAWTPKFTGHALGINHKDRFVLQDNLGTTVAFEIQSSSLAGNETKEYTINKSDLYADLAFLSSDEISVTVFDYGYY